MSISEPEVLIIGGGAAGHACATTLRGAGFSGTITVVNGEGGPAINRTLVDTGLLPGLLTPEQIALPPVKDVEHIEGRAVALDAETHTVTLDDGRELRTDALVIACGSSARSLDPSVQVDSGATVHFLHTAADATALRWALPEPVGARLAVLGSGFIGAEVASHYAAVGAEVVLLGRSEQPLRAAVGAEIAERLAVLHRKRVDARFGTVVRSITAGPRQRGVSLELADGSRVVTDELVVALGTTPESGWAGAPAGIPTDDRLRAIGQPSTYAAGSVAVHELDGAAMRIDHWDAASAQGVHAARTLLHDLCGGEDPGAYVPRTGFTLSVYGTSIAARGVRISDSLKPGDAERLETTTGDASSALTEFWRRDGSLSGVAGFNAGAALMRAAARIEPAVWMVTRPGA